MIFLENFPTGRGGGVLVNSPDALYFSALDVLNCILVGGLFALF